MSVAEKKIYKYYIGIDCGVSTGICVWNKNVKVIEKIQTVKIHEAMEEVRRWSYGGFLMVRVEDARQRKKIPWQKDEKKERGRREGAGYVKRDAVIWQDFLTELGVDFEMVAPAKNKTKVSADYFKKLTGYAGTTSKHSRDAGMLVIGY